MKIYGLTIISSEGDLSVQKENGKYEYCESETRLFTDKQKRINYAVTAMKDIFNNFEFEDEVDYNDRSIGEFEEDLRKEEDICIQDCSSHACFEFFTQDMGIDIVNREDYIATKLWSEEDVAAKLKEEGFASTPENVSAVINTGCLKRLNDCTDQDWEIISYAISQAEIDRFA